MVCALTTSDNPYDPFKQWDEWYQYDESHGYHSSSLLARLAPTSYGLPPSINDTIIEQAIDSIIANVPLSSSDGSAFYVKAIDGVTHYPIKSA